MAGAFWGGTLDGMTQHTDTTRPDATASAPGAPTGSADPDPSFATFRTGTAPLPGTSPAPRFTLRRSRTDRMLGGVCGGLAESLGADAALLRVLAVALTVITGGAAAIVYLAAWALAPEDDRPAAA
jgi:phage shock protein C